MTTRTATLALAALLVLSSAVGCGQDDTEDEGWPGIDASADFDGGGGDDADDAGGDGGRDADGGGDVGGDVGGDADASDDADGGEDEPACGTEDTEDSDGDGLYDCEEEILCTDEHKSDTDGDGLDDARELSERTDPCDADTDGDGLDDGLEVDIGLDPNKSSTFDDGVEDIDRWAVDVCEDYEEELEAGHTKRIAQSNVIALASSFDEPTELTLSPDYDEHFGAVVSDHDEHDLKALFFADDFQGSNTVTSDAVERLADHREELTGAAEIISEYNGGDLYAQDQLLSTPTLENANTPRTVSHYRVEWPEAASTDQVREALLFELSPFEPEEVSGLPETEGEEYTEFYIEVATHTAPRNSSGSAPDTPAATSVAIAPASEVEQGLQSEVRAAIDTTHLYYHTLFDERCKIVEPDEPPEVDVYIVLDTSEETNAHADHVDQALGELYDRLDASFFDARYGVTNMDPDDRGQFREGVGWITDRDALLGEVATQRDAGHADDEYDGVEAAREGLQYYFDAEGQLDEEDTIRDDARVLTVFLTDRPLDDFAYEERSYLSEATVIFAGVGGDDECCGGDGDAHTDLADDTGGAHTGIDDDRLGESLARFALESGDDARPYPLTPSDISGTLDVYRDGQRLEMSATDGYLRAPRSDSIVFAGSAGPDHEAESGETPDYLVLRYRYYDVPIPD